MHLFGAARVITPDDADVDLSGKPVMAGLLTYLTLNRRRSLHSLRIAAALWPEDMDETHADGKAEKRLLDRLRYQVSALRSALGPTGPEVLRTVGAAYRLDVEDTAVDIARFAHAVHQAEILRGSDPVAALAAARDALAMWDEPLESARFADFAQLEITHLEQRRNVAREVIAGCELLLGRHQQAIHELEPLLRDEPYNEGPLALYMQALFRAGRQRDALRAFGDFAHRLASASGLEPSADLRRLESRILEGDLTLHRGALTSPRSASDHWEPSAGFIGRSRAMQTVRRLLVEHRLVTLSGIGGLGKTRLAREVGSSLEAAGRDVAFVDLTTAAGPGSVASEIARTLDVRVEPGQAMEVALVDALRTWSGVVILDNCEEHLAEAATAAGALITQCPDLHILATSRLPLGAEHEFAWAVPPLSLPRSDAADDVRQSSTVRLLLSQAADPDGLFATASPHAWTRLARLVGGLPLLCRSVAGLLDVAGPEELADLVERDALHHDDDVGPSSHSAAAILGWSLDRLEPETRLILTAASVCAGSFTRDALDGVLPSSVPPAARLHALKTLRTVALIDCAEDKTFRIAEPVRHVVLTTADTNVVADLRKNHLAYFEEHARRNGRALLVDDTALDVIDADLGNLRTAMAWALEHDEWIVAGRIAAAMDLYWLWSGRCDEGLRWVNDALARRPTDSEPGGWVGISTAELVRSAGFLASIDGQYAVAISRLEESIDRFSTVLDGDDGDERQRYVAEAGRAWARFHLGRTHSSMLFTGESGIADSGADQYRLATDTSRALGLEPLTCWMLPFAGWHASITASGRASALLAEAIDLAERLRLREPLAISRSVMGLHHMVERRFDAAAAEIAAGVKGLEATRNLYSLQIALSLAAVLALRTDDPETDHAVRRALEVMHRQSSREFDALTAGVACVRLAAKNDGAARPLARWLDDTTADWVATLATVGVHDAAEARRRALETPSFHGVPDSARQAADLALRALAEE